MTAKPGRKPVSFWRKHRIKLAAVAVVAVLAWLAYFLENVPVTRNFSAADSGLAAISDEQAVRFGGIAAGPVGSLRLGSARRMRMTISGGADLRSPDPQAFETKAAKDQAALAGISCAKGSMMIDAQPGAGETVAAAVGVADVGQSGGLLIGKAAQAHSPNRWLVRGDDAKITLAVDLSRGDDAPPSGQMVLCRSGVSATLGHAEIELQPGTELVVEFLEPDPNAGNAPAALFELQQSLAVSSIALARLTEGEPFEPDRIACGAAKAGTVLWGRLIPRVDLSGCKPKSLFVSDIDLASGKILVSKSPAYFGNFQADKDSAHFVSRALKNPVVQQLLVPGILGGIIVPWVIAQFRRRKRAAKK
jgi:hypothetical protein